MRWPRLALRLLLGRRLPITAGCLKVAGIEGPVSIRRDTYGIPHISAGTEDDAWYGLGFCQGQDRAFQLEMLLRVTRGTLAELIGAEGLPVDRLSRRIGFHRAAQALLDVLDDETRRMIEAYARGVTDGATVGCRRKAHEFVLLRARPTPFTAADTLGIVKALSFRLASNWDCELARFKILTADGPEALMALDPTYPRWLPVTSPPGALAGAAVDRLSEDLALLRDLVGGVGGSNSWAIASCRTVTGRPLLANDPHLSPSIPPHWYLAHLRTPHWSAAGASFVGGPAFPAGHNGIAAWGNTAGLLDNTDLFLEEIGPDGHSVRQGDGFVACVVRQETIQIKGEDPFQEQVLITPRGPIIGPALDGEVRSVSLRAVWLDPRPVEGLLQIHRARTFEDFRHAFRAWPSLPLNMVYADVTGTVGWQLVGEAPQRRKGWGTMPTPGWDPGGGWFEEPVAFEAMPYLANPKCGFVATANNQPTADGDGPFVGVDWIDGYRLLRIVETLEERHDWDLKRMQRLQMDQLSLPWRELRHVVLALPANSAEVHQAQSLLRRWEGVLEVGSVPATIFEFFIAEMSQRIVEAKAPRAAQWALGRGSAPTSSQSMLYSRSGGRLVRLVRDQPEGWFSRSWSDEMADALREVMKSLRERYGQDPRQWGWGHVRPLTLRHAMGHRPRLGQVFNLGPLAWGGDVNTVSQASGRPGDPAANPSTVASMRMVVDVGCWEASRFVLPGGQSGNPLSPHYDDLLPHWQSGEGVPIAWSEEQVRQATKTVLQLVPK